MQISVLKFFFSFFLYLHPILTIILYFPFFFQLSFYSFCISFSLLFCYSFFIFSSLIIFLSTVVGFLNLVSKTPTHHVMPPTPSLNTSLLMSIWLIHMALIQTCYRAVPLQLSVLCYMSYLFVYVIWALHGQSALISLLLFNSLLLWLAILLPLWDTHFF